MSDDEEKTEVAKISAVLDVKHDLRTDEEFTRRLSYLTGDISAREKVRRFLHPDAFAYNNELFSALYIARNRDLVLELLEKGLRDSSQPVTHSLLQLVSSLRYSRENPPGQIEPKAVNGLTPGNPNLQFEGIQNRYLSELILGLSKRSGESLTTTAMTILTSVPKSDPNRATLIAEARRALVQKFGSLHASDQEFLLHAYWDDLRDGPMLVPLKQILSSSLTGKSAHDSALQRLIEISSDEARPFAIKEICEPLSFADYKIVDRLNDKTLPEVDECLVTQLKQYAKSQVSRDRILLEQKTCFAARFATPAIYQSVAEIYRDNGASLTFEIRAAFLAYLAKQNETDALPLIEQALEQLPPGQNFNFLPRLTDLYYSPAISDIVKRTLAGNEPYSASNAAYLVGCHGSAGDENILIERLQRWQKEWRGRVEEAEVNQQGMIERELVWALVNGKAWKFSPERVKELKLSCLTTMCKQSNRIN
jgi:hypothetical protein